MRGNVMRAVEILGAARHGGGPADRLPESLVPQTVADEYELQNRLNVYLSQAGVGPVVGVSP